MFDRKGNPNRQKYHSWFGFSPLKELKLSKEEYAHVISEIRTFATKEQKESGFFVKFVGNNFYFVEYSEEKDYIIVRKGKIK